MTNCNIFDHFVFFLLTFCQIIKIIKGFIMAKAIRKATSWMEKFESKMEVWADRLF